MYFYVWLVAIVITLVNQADGKLISNLPGLETSINFKQYSGYVTVDAQKQTRLFYWFVESQSNSTSDPLVLWLNGGPGCSSLSGFFEELGPFYVKSDLTLGLNDQSWNRVSNMLFLESPAGVGFSKTNASIPYTDERTAADSLAFLLKFFEMYPQLKSLDFWITGESYGGHYIPTLAAKIIEHNKQHTTTEDHINLKGLMIGNPLTYLTINNGGAVDYIYSHQLISNATYSGWRKYCNYTYPDNPHQTPNQVKCGEFQTKAQQEMGSINPYSIYSDVCIDQSPGRSLRSGQALVHALAGLDSGLSWFWKRFLKQPALTSPFYPCEGNYVTAYLNNPAVQKAVFAETTKWAACSLAINDLYSKSDVAASMLPIYNNTLFGNGLKILIYSGDTDTVVSATSTRRCLSLLNLKTVQSWEAWMDSKGQVGGYKEVTNELTYATVRNAGHEVPTYQPLRAFDMFSRFLKGHF